MLFVVVVCLLFVVCGGLLGMFIRYGLSLFVVACCSLVVVCCLLVVVYCLWFVV